LAPGNFLQIGNDELTERITATTAEKPRQLL
jgi:hypothetical protein